MALNYYRSDGWVKTTQGPAVPGAQVYVLTQPANVVAPITPPRTTPVPFVPNPQALIYADDGTTLITQPVITDGFGHYDFYVLPGLYTVAIYYGGKLQQFYVDQSIGNVGTAGSPTVTFKTNGTPNFNQSLQNLVQGANVIISTDNLGNTTIAATVPTPPPSIDLETNGVSNADQAKLNLVQGSGATITDDGSGNITISSSGGSTPSSGTTITPLLGRNVFGGMFAGDGFWVCRIPASAITSFPKKSKFTMELLFVSSPAPIIGSCVLVRTLPNDLNVIDRTIITWGGSSNPTLSFGINTSDEISLQIDSAHDYWFALAPQFGVDFQLNCLASSVGTMPVEGGRPASDPTVANPMPTSVSNGSSVFVQSWFGTVYP